MKSTKVGIDIGNNEVKCAVIEEKNGIYNLIKCDSFKVSNKLDEKGYIKSLKKGINAFLKRNKIRTASLNFTIPVNPLEVIVKVLDMPLIEQKLMDSSIQNELEVIYTEDLNEYEKRWVVVNQDTDLKEITVLTVLLKKAISKMLNEMANVTCKVETIEIQAVTVGRLIKGTAIFIDFGFDATRIYAYKEGQIIDVQVVKKGGKYLAEKIIAYRGSNTTFEDADKLLGNVELQPDPLLRNNLSVSSLITDELDLLTDEVKRSIRGIEINHNIELENIFYSGELANIPEFSDYLTAKLDFVVKPVEFLNTEDDDKALSNKYLYAGACILASSYGYLKDINYAEKKIIPVNLDMVLMILVSLLLFSQLGFVDIHRRYDDKLNISQETLTDLQQQVSAKDNEISLKRNEMYQSEILKNKLSNIEMQKNWLADIFYIIPDKTPVDVIITNIFEKKGITVIEGESTNYTAIGVLAMGLEEYGIVEIENIEDGLPLSEEINKEETVEDADKKQETNKKQEVEVPQVEAESVIKFKIIVSHNVNLLNN